MTGGFHEMCDLDEKVFDTILLHQYNDNGNKSFLQKREDLERGGTET